MIAPSARKVDDGGGLSPQGLARDDFGSAAVVWVLWSSDGERGGVQGQGGGAVSRAGLQRQSARLPI